MRVPGHVIVSTAGSVILYKYTRSVPASLWFLIMGITVDMDHYLDYVREKGVSLDFKKVYEEFRYPAYTTLKKVLLILHSYELLAILWLAILVFNLNLVWKCAALGLTLHLIIDQVTNPVVPLAYFILFRAANKFDTKKIIYRGRLKRDGGGD